MTLILAVIISWLLAYFRAGSYLWTLCVLLLLGKIVIPEGVIYTIAVLGVAITLALILNLPTLRRAILTKPLLNLFKRMLPPLSARSCIVSASAGARPAASSRRSPPGSRRWSAWPKPH